MPSLDELILRIPYGLASRLRQSVFRLLGMRIGARCRIESIRIRRPRRIAIGEGNALTEGCWLWPADQDGPPAIVIGHRNYFNRNVMIDACGVIEVGNGNLIGPDVYITDSNHTVSHEAGAGELPMDVGRVKIGNHCWIGAKAILLKDVELGDGCIVAAGAVVTRSFPRGSVVAGVPARCLRVSVPAPGERDEK